MSVACDTLRFVMMSLKHQWQLVVVVGGEAGVRISRVGLGVGGRERDSVKKVTALKTVVLAPPLSLLSSG